ncbi:MAG: subtype I-B CRISPR-associated endonuclease Cas1 [Chloroflexi bacterium]|nr:MAG: subtype I-B CRISPR-associated endonuclease Cas1 [Chloroflexota bacterium]
MKKKNYYILSDGKLIRRENTLYFENEDGKKPIPINAVYAIYALGSLSITSKAISLLAKEGVCIHFFNRYGYYVGSFYPRETLISGDLIVRQVEHYLDRDKRLFLARCFVEGAVRNMQKVLAPYGLSLDFDVNLDEVKSIQELMGFEALARQNYYSLFEEILKDFEFGGRSKRPPKNEINAMISFGNSLLYSTIISELYHTQLNPTISYLHEPFERRFSLALDMAEIFKPFIVDRLIFYLVNKRIIKAEDFNRDLDCVLLNERGYRKFIKAYNEKLESTIKHRQLKRNVSYQRLIRLECYKLIKHLLGVEKFKPLVIWW